MSSYSDSSVEVQLRFILKLQWCVNSITLDYLNAFVVKRLSNFENSMARVFKTFTPYLLRFYTARPNGWGNLGYCPGPHICLGPNFITVNIYILIYMLKIYVQNSCRSHGNLRPCIPVFSGSNFSNPFSLFFFSLNFLRFILEGIVISFQLKIYIYFP